jgi:hypothetical protein
MSLGRLLKSTFSPYEIAAIGLVGALILALIGTLALATGLVGLALILMLPVVPIAFAVEEWSRCPVCGKPPIVRQGHDRDRFASVFLRRRRIWPETTCSECGTPLNVGRDDRP